MQSKNGFRTDVQFRVLLMDQAECLLVTAHFYFFTITQMPLAENNGSNSALIDLYTLDAVGGHGALDERVLPQYLEALRRLAREKFMLTAVLR